MVFLIRFETNSRNKKPGYTSIVEPFVLRLALALHVKITSGFNKLDNGIPGVTGTRNPEPIVGKSEQAVLESIHIFMKRRPATSMDY